jgi:hypothetical protein
MIKLRLARSGGRHKFRRDTYEFWCANENIIQWLDMILVCVCVITTEG